MRPLHLVIIQILLNIVLHAQRVNIKIKMAVQVVKVAQQGNIKEVLDVLDVHVVLKVDILEEAHHLALVVVE